MVWIIGSKHLARHQRHIVVRQALDTGDIHNRDDRSAINVGVTQRNTITQVAIKTLNHIEHRDWPKEIVGGF